MAHVHEMSERNDDGPSRGILELERVADVCVYACACPVGPYPYYAVREAKTAGRPAWGADGSCCCFLATWEYIRSIDPLCALCPVQP